MLNEQTCWNAVTGRDATADGQFVYAVKTTGVYCRPGCASRQPKRENVTFFESPAAAEAEGFRACKRCRPAESSAAARHLAAIEKACRLIRAADTPPSLDTLANAVGMSRFHFHRLFRQITGTTPREYARTWRLNRFADSLDAGRPVTEAIYEAGYGSGARAYAVSNSGLGMTPSARRNGGKGETVRFTTARSALGWVLVAATERGICATELGDEPDALVEHLRERFPAADLIEDQGDLRHWAERIVRFIAAPGQAPDLPLDIQGTAFQAQVWRALREIPPGTTVSYAEMAAALGRPTAVRAVARACAANKLAVLIPCHRVVRSDGGLGGYRWGVERKRALLQREETAVADANVRLDDVKRHG